jgi:hypothetical protein
MNVGPYNAIIYSFKAMGLGVKIPIDASPVVNRTMNMQCTYTVGLKYRQQSTNQVIAAR